MGYGFIPEYKKEREMVATGASTVWKAINSIYDMLNVEWKNHDYIQEDVLGTGGVFSDLTQIAAGITGGVSTDGVLDVGYRDGDSILVKSCFIKGHFLSHSSASTPMRVRLTLIRFYPGFTGDAPVDTELYDDATSTIGVDRMQNLRHTKRYKIIATRLFSLGQVQDDNRQQNFEIYKQWRRSHIQWEGSSANAPSNGKIYLHMQNTQDTVNGAIYNWSARTRYIDN